MMPFEHLAAKHGMEASPRQPAPTSICHDADQGYRRLVDLLERFRAVAKVGRLRPGRYTAGGFGLFFSPKWRDAECQQEIHDLFWSESGVVFMERNGDELPVYRNPVDDIPEDLWVRHS